MTNAFSSVLIAISASFLVVALASCARFESMPGGDAPDPAPFLGEWVSDDGVSPGEAITVELGLGGELLATYTDIESQDTISGTVQLVDVDGLTVAGLAAPDGTYDLVAVSVVSDTLYSRTPDLDQLQSDIESGVLSGDVLRVPNEPYDTALVVSASPAELRQYFVDTPDVFPTDNTGYLVRPTASPPLARAVETGSDATGMGLLIWMLAGVLGVAAVAALLVLARRPRS